MILVGLTGGIGSGKSTVINHFKELGVNCYQADKEAKKLMDSDHDLISKIQNSFGDKIKELPEANRISLRGLGRLTDVSGMHISNIEKNKMNLRIRP